MLQVTPQAISELHGMLTRAVAQQPTADAGNVGFRLVASAAREGEGSELGLALDAPREGDAVIRHDGSSVLLLDAATSELLGDLTLDLIETPGGARLGIRE